MGQSEDVLPPGAFIDGRLKEDVLFDDLRAVCIKQHRQDEEMRQI